MFHALMQDFDGRAHRSHHPSANNSLRELEVMKAKQVHALVKIEQLFGQIVQSEELRMAAIEFVDA